MNTALFILCVIGAWAVCSTIADFHWFAFHYDPLKHAPNRVKVTHED